MGGEWSKAVKIIFNKKYSNGRGKLADAMRDSETRALHSSMLGKKPMKQTKFMKVKNTNFKKTQKLKKTKRGGQGQHASDTPNETEEEEEEEEEQASDNTPSEMEEEEAPDNMSSEIENRLSKLENAVKELKQNAEAASGSVNEDDNPQSGGKRYKRMNKKSKSFRKKNSNW